MKRHTATEKVYAFVGGDAEERICKDIPESACTNLPRNFLLNAASGTSSKLAEQLAGPELVLPWLLASLGAPAAIVGFLVPVRQAGSLLPQIAVAGMIRGTAKRKWFWSGSALIQALTLALMWPAALLLSPAAAGWTILGLLLIFSLASGIASVAFSDVVGKTIPKGRRGLLLSVRATSGGLLALAAGLIIKATVTNDAELMPYIVLIMMAAVLWVIAATLFGSISETPGSTGGGRSAFAEFGEGLRLLRADSGFARFVVTRSLLLTVELSVPFYALYARAFSGDKLADLGLYLIATALAEVLSSPVWGKFADRASHKVMAAGGLVACASGLYALALTLLPASWQAPHFAAVTFLLIGFAKSGVRMGRKTYLIDYAPAEQRPLYVALSNTLIGLLAVAGSVFGLIAQAFGVNVVILVLLICALGGAIFSMRLPQAERD